MLNRLMGMVPNASDHGWLIDHMLEFAHWFMLALFVGWTLFFLFTLFHFRRGRHPRADYHGVQSHTSTHLEFGVIVVEAVLVLGFAIPLWSARATKFPEKDSQIVNVIGEQFTWNFHYPGRDGVFGRQDARFIDATNPVGLDPNDRASLDDLVTRNELHLLKDKPTILQITSKDVIHSVSIHHMRIGQDAIPGTRVPIWFKPIRETPEDKPFEIVCAQLCGLGHYSMRAMMFVDPPERYEAWIKEMETLKGAPAPQPAAAPAPTQPQQAAPTGGAEPKH